MKNMKQTNTFPENFNEYNIPNSYLKTVYRSCDFLILAEKP